VRVRPSRLQTNMPKSPETVAALSGVRATNRDLLTICWQTALSGSAADALCPVELRGFEPLTPCMLSRDPHHGTHHRTLRSRAFHQRRTADAWWLVWLS
jgi:hypothetical protein